MSISTRVTGIILMRSVRIHAEAGRHAEAANILACAAKVTGPVPTAIHLTI